MRLNDPKLTRVLRALADPTRRRVYEMLLSGPRSTSSVAHGMLVSRPAVSQHLRELKRAGLIAVQRSGSRYLYAIDWSGPAPLCEWLGSVCRPTETESAARVFPCRLFHSSIDSQSP